MKILVVGSKGFIGSYTYNYFKSLKFEVIGCDVIADYEDQNYFQIEATNSDYHFLFENNQINVCINCSGAASVPLSLNFPLRDFNLNTVNVFKILEAIKMYQPTCKFINLSSAAVYGNPASLPIKENSFLKPLSPYGIHKLQSEEICQEFYDFYNIPTCSLRIFSAYGNGLKKQLFWDLYQKFNTKSVIELFGTGKETRDFIHVNDIINAIHLVINNSNFQAEKINIANGKEYTIGEISEIFKNSLQTNKEIVFNNIVKQGDPLNWKADINLLESMGYKSKVSIENGINNYIQWIKEL
ncbi:NAD-dependent epimerase/dehydratase family protein [Flavobacterium sp.]|uniref:NAD-dependent epimerase/dehydratase family protein n=1 Tax=Flavobacterium sp. TaxID=239 RepID=UPI0037517A97